MKKLAGVIVALIMMVFISALANAPVYAADFNNFYIKDYQIDYYLARDKNAHATLETAEVITAVFPETNQNHGLERAIPTSYDGHTTSLRLISVTDANNVPRAYSTRTENGNLILRIGDDTRYVHGAQTYKITYTQLDVTKYFSDTNRDEFYWDTNGVDTAVPVNSLAVRLHLAENLSATLTHNQQCYRGTAGSTDRCEITATNDGYHVRAANLAPYENVTIAVGFTPHTFAPYTKTLAEWLKTVWLWSLLVTLPVAVVLLVIFLSRNYHRSYRLREVRTIIPEYLPPKGVSVYTASVIANKPGRTFTAQLIDLAVRRYLKIYQTREKSWLKRVNYELEIVKDISSLSAEEQDLLRAIFGDTSVGARLDMETLKHNTAIALKVAENRKKLGKRIGGEYGLRHRNNHDTTWFKRAAIITLIAAVLTLSPWLLVAAITAGLCAFTIKPLTDKGLTLFRHLKGLEMYIRTAETDRLRMLQSPEGAEKIGAPLDTNDKRQLIKLYERVLPYAVLFGQEKEWNSRLGQYYQDAGESPAWYSGNNATFNAVAFSAAMSNFNNVASYSSASSSSSGGSSGGGSSGGGGGGGGSGGW